MKKKIIIAEDSSVIQNLTKQVLAKLNCEIDTVKNGKKLLEKVEKKKYDLLLLDILMPGLNGMECAKHIRSSSGENKDLPIVIMSGNNENFSKKDFEELAIRSFIPKPIDYDKLISIVESI